MFHQLCLRFCHRLPKGKIVKVIFSMKLANPLIKRILLVNWVDLNWV